MTFSLAARCPDTGMFGIGITTSDICVGSRCPFILPGVGAALTQHRTDPRLGPRMLDHLAAGKSAREAIALAVKETPYAHWRQLACVDSKGQTASYHGDAIDSIHSHAEGNQVIAVGNILATHAVPGAMIAGFEASKGSLASRLLDALDAGLAAGGETFELQSAALLVYQDQSFPSVDLRIDNDREPLSALRSLLDAYEPLADLFKMRAVDPDSIPDRGG